MGKNIINISHRRFALTAKETNYDKYKILLKVSLCCYSLTITIALPIT